MTTRDFIKNNLGEPSTRERHCSSVYANSKGDIFSYGPHYPLVFTVAGETFINVSGYSMTTAKHIIWAKNAVDYNYTPVELWKTEADIIADPFATDEQRLMALERATMRMIKQRTEERNKKKRTDTQVYKDLTAQIAQAVASWTTVFRLKGVEL